MSESKKIPQTVSLNPAAKYTVPIIPTPGAGCPVFLPHSTPLPPQPTVPIYNSGEIDILVATFVVTVDRGTATGNLCFMFFANKKLVAVIEVPTGAATPPPFKVQTQSFAFTTDKLTCKELLSVAVTSDVPADVGILTTVTLDSLGLTYCVSCCHK